MTPINSSITGYKRALSLEPCWHWLFITSRSLLHLVLQLCSTLCDPTDRNSPGSSVHGDSPGKNTGVGCPPPEKLPDPRIEPRSPSLQADSLLSEPPGKFNLSDCISPKIESSSRASFPVLFKVTFPVFWFILTTWYIWASQVTQWVKNSPANAGDTRDTVSISGSGRLPGGGNGNRLQYSCLENSMDRGVWCVTVHGVTKSQTRLQD